MDGPLVYVCMKKRAFFKIKASTHVGVIFSQYSGILLLKPCLRTISFYFSWILHISMLELALILKNVCFVFSPNITVRSHLVVLIGDMYGLENFCLSGKPLRRIVSDDFRFFCPWARPLMPALEDHYNDVMNFSVNAGQQLLRYHGKSMYRKLSSRSFFFKYIVM